MNGVSAVASAAAAGPGAATHGPEPRLPSHAARFIAGFALALAALLAISVFSYRGFNQFAASAQWVDHTYRIIGSLDELLSALNDAETGHRGFLLTGDEDYLEPYSRATVDISRLLRSIELEIHDSQQQTALRELSGLMAIKREQLERNIRMKKSGSRYDAVELLPGLGMTDRLNLCVRRGGCDAEMLQGLELTEQIRTQVKVMKAEEQRLLAQRAAEVETASARNKRVIILGNLTALLLLLLASGLLLREIARRKRSEAQRERFFSLSLDMLCIAGLDGYFKRLNPAFNQTLGYTTNELQARPFLDFVHPDDRAATLAEMEKLGRGEPTIQFENRYQCKDGSWKWLSWRVQPFPSEGLLYATARDITDRKHLEEQMVGNIKTLTEFKTALDEHAIVAITDARGKITYANDKFSAISKYACEELLGQNHRIINSGHHPKAFIRDLWQTITSGRIWKGELKNRAKDGSFYWVDTTIVPFLDEHGKPSQYIAIRADITERKQAEEKIEQLNTDLVARAAQLDASNKELESFSYSVSHDLRSPLRAIGGYALMLEEDYHERLDDEGRRLLRTVRDNAARMSRLIDNLLAFSRLGRTAINATSFDMEALAREVAAELQHGESNARAQLRIEALPAGYGDRVLLRQVWVNLLGNALKYSAKRDAPLIEVSGRVEGGECIYGVKDNGAGFDMRYYDKLFGVFQRLHGADEFAGTGVGLAIVQRIVARHGGRVWAEGQPEAGASFYFSLPVKESEHG